MKTIFIELSDEQYEAWQTAANRTEMKLLDWVRDACQLRIELATAVSVLSGKLAQLRKAPANLQGMIDEEREQRGI